MNHLLLWAQTQADLPGVDRLAVAKLALRRFFAGLTLSSPEANPGYVPLLGLLSGLAGLAILAVLFQGPLGVLRQFFDIPGHWRVICAATVRLRRASRLVAVLFGSTVLSWTVWQSRWFSHAEGLENLGNLLKRKSVVETATEQGLLAALTPLRELCALSGNLVVLIAASALIFKVSSERWNAYSPSGTGSPGRSPRWMTTAWVSSWIYLIYRLACHIWRPEGPALGRLPWVELFLIPALALVCDGLLLGWVLSELARARTDSQQDTIAETVRGAVARLPGAVVACLFILPARYVAQVAWLATRCLPSTAPPWSLRLLGFVLVDWGLVWLQTVGFILLPLICGAAWAGARSRFMPTVFSTLRSEGGRLLAIVATCSAGIFGLASTAYLALLSLPAQPWLLLAADSYSHYLCLPVGLLLASALVELADRSLPARQPSMQLSEPAWLEIDEPAPAA